MSATLDAHLELQPALPWPTRIGAAQRLVLAYLADEGPIDCPDGGAVTIVAEALNLSGSHTANLVKRLDELGLVERNHGVRRTYHLGITHTGRGAIGREASWHRRQRRGRQLEKLAAVAPPAMPVAGAFARTAFDPEAARAAQAEWSVLW